MTSSLPPEAAFSVLLQLRDSPKRELVNVKTGRNQPTIYQITDVLHGVEPVDRTAINAWEDEDFVRAVKATNRKKLVMAALWTEVCLVHPALDAMAEGFEVYPVVDCVGGTYSASSASFKPAPGR